MRPLVLLPVAALLAGCAHAAEFRLHATNDSAAPVEVEVTFLRGEALAASYGWTVGAHESSPPVDVRLKPGVYLARAQAGPHVAERTHDFGSSTLGVHVLVTVGGVEIGIAMS